MKIKNNTATINVKFNLQRHEFFYLVIASLIREGDFFNLIHQKTKKEIKEFAFKFLYFKGLTEGYMHELCMNRLSDAEINTAFEILDNKFSEFKSDKITKKVIRKNLIDKGYDAKIVEKAIQKSIRWQYNAFGHTDWEEVGIEQVELYAKETISKPSGKKTFNRGYVT